MDDRFAPSALGRTEDGGICNKLAPSALGGTEEKEMDNTIAHSMLGKKKTKKQITASRPPRSERQKRNCVTDSRDCSWESERAQKCTVY